MKWKEPDFKEKDFQGTVAATISTDGTVYYDPLYTDKIEKFFHVTLKPKLKVVST